MHWMILTAMLIAFVLSVVICPLFIKILRRLQFGQQIREDGPTRHRLKAGTPTAGGVVFLLAAVAALLILRAWSAAIGLALFVTLGNALIGWLDDSAKIARSRSQGLKARSKLFGQLIVALAFTAGIYLFGDYSSVVVLPFSGREIDLAYLYPLFVLVIISAATNGVNLTDGIDGLATGTVVIALLAFLYIASTRDLPDMALFCGAMIGGCFGFLVYNLHPARIFMGDAGSLGLGGALAAAAVLTKTELLLVIIGGVFVLEVLSVILQVISFQLTRRRIFLMAPLHHHFELKGWSEWQVVTGFWGLAFIFALAGLIEVWQQIM
ncbi:MAG: phospho-N-acetylmuramoyl-pentapeptide-transferase [Bacillota bacterium]